MVRANLQGLGLGLPGNGLAMQWPYIYAAAARLIAARTLDGHFFGGAKLRFRNRQGNLLVIELLSMQKRAETSK